MAEVRSSLKVFLCHASADKPRVRELYRYLKKRGISPWLDEVNLIGGQDWQVEIPKALRACDAVLVLLTRNAVDKEGYVQKEIKFALDKALELPEGRIFLIPVRFEDCEVPPSLNRYQWVDLFDPNGYRRLMKSLRTRAAQLGRATVEVPERVGVPTEPGPELPRSEAGSTSQPGGAEATGTEAEKVKEGEHERRPRKAPPAKPPAPGASSKAPLGKRPRWMAAFIGLAVLVLVVVLGFLVPPLLRPPMAATTGTVTAPTAASTSTFVPPSITPSPSETPTESAAASPTSAPASATSPVARAFDPHPNASDYVDVQGVAMRLVPAGVFTMGDDHGQPNEKPATEMSLDAYYIDKYEVTNALYKACVAAGACDAPAIAEGGPNYYNKADDLNYPVVYVDWYMAGAYCKWRDARLPTEAEWEKAALPAGPSYYGNSYMTQVGAASYSSGKTYFDISAFGAYDLIASVREWVSSLYQPYPYSPTDGREDSISTDSRVLRGGSFTWGGVRSYSQTFRTGESPEAADFYIGFRCARSQ